MRKSVKKEFLYVGYYYDIKNRFVLKIGTTNSLERRQKEHTYNYRKCPDYTMPKTAIFEYLWTLPLSKYNTLRYEDTNKEDWIAKNYGKYIRNDRFVFEHAPIECSVKIKKTYTFKVRATVEG